VEVGGERCEELQGDVGRCGFPTPPTPPPPPPPA
jgi:hypothetical protein